MGLNQTYGSQWEDLHWLWIRPYLLQLEDYTGGKNHEVERDLRFRLKLDPQGIESE